MSEPIIIVGAGVSGLRAASLLISQGIDCIVLEARDRVGGRVLSESVKEKPELGKYDLGPTWFWPLREPVITRLVKELNLKAFDQYTNGEILFEQFQNGPIQRHTLPEEADPKSVRLEGGLVSLIDAIATELPNETIELSSKVTGIYFDGEKKLAVEVELADGKKKSIRGRAVILALPPRIIAENIVFLPALPERLKISLRDKYTWMGGQAKVVAIYDRPFWREDGLSGQAISRSAILQEIHDASPLKGSGALFGFFGITPENRRKLGQDRVLELVIEQLTRFFGRSAGKPISLMYKDWSSDTHTSVAADSEPLINFPDYGLPIHSAQWENKLVFAGTETSSAHGGHIEGALVSAERAVSKVIQLLQVEDARK